MNGALAHEVVPLCEDEELFRCFDFKAESLEDLAPFNQTSCRKMALEFMYQSKYIPFSYKLQLDDKILESYTDAFQTVLSDVSCFPVAYDGVNGQTVSFQNSWGSPRNFGGDRRHEGVDIMTSNNVPGYFPAVSMCDGTIEKMGWLKLGGYRIGIRSEHGMYAYYAHLDSYREGLSEGDQVRAGDILGYVGNSGYGEEGTKGKFDVHLHFGMYIDIDGKETSINPYEILRYLQGDDWKNGGKDESNKGNKV